MMSVESTVLQKRLNTKSIPFIVDKKWILSSIVMLLFAQKFDWRLLSWEQMLSICLRALTYINATLLFFSKFMLESPQVQDLWLFADVVENIGIKGILFVIFFASKLPILMGPVTSKLQHLWTLLSPPTHKWFSLTYYDLSLCSSQFTAKKGFSSAAHFHHKHRALHSEVYVTITA